MRASDIPEVRSLDLFASMTDSNFGQLVKAAYLQTFPAQVELIREGDPSDFLHVVVDGCVELYAQSNGRRSSIAMVRPLSTFILAAVIKDAVYLMSARTTRQSRILMIPAENIRRAFNADDDFARAIVTELASCYRGVIKQYKDIKLRSTVERLANRLLRYHNDQGTDGSIELPHDKRVLASLMGMSPENLSRAFNSLKQYGVKVDGSKVYLRDLNSLTVLAKPNHLIDDRYT